MKIGLLAVLTLYFSEHAWAKDMGIRGPVYHIQEPDLLEWIEMRLKQLLNNGQLLMHQKEMQQHAIAYVKRPAPVQDIVKATHNRTFMYDPSITVPYDLTDQDGKVFHKAGTKVNPLDSVMLAQPLLFFDSDDKAQVDWAKTLDQIHKGNTKFILVNGSILEQIEQWHRPVYFDQGGLLIKKLGVKQVPAIVSQKGKLLFIEEIKLN